jgi:hypothetical protein
LSALGGRGGKQDWNSNALQGDGLASLGLYTDAMYGPLEHVENLP